MIVRGQESVHRRGARETMLARKLPRMLESFRGWDLGITNCEGGSVVVCEGLMAEG